MLTDRQREIYEFIRAYLRRHGVAPKLREIGARFGIASRGVVHRHLRALAAAGLIAVEPGRHRGIRLKGAAAGRLPFLGRIAAGRPIEAVPGEEEIDLAAFFLGPNRFVLRVLGDSMVGDGILEGDMVVVEKRATARSNEIVVALIDGTEATLKRLRHNRDGSITLIAANPRIPPMRYSAERVQIQGVVVGQFRSYR
jgi:repressor LexA